MSRVHDKLMRRMFPAIKWDEPIKITVIGKHPLFCCRLCIADRGLKATDVDKEGFETAELFQQHYQHAHALPSEVLTNAN